LDFYVAQWKLFLHKVINSIRVYNFFDEDDFHKEMTEFKWQWVQKDKICLMSHRETQLKSANNCLKSTKAELNKKAKRQTKF
jgi:hypothetical protein